MEIKGQDQPSGSSPWVAPPRRLPEPPPEDSDFLLTWSRSTTHAPPEPERPPEPPRRSARFASRFGWPPGGNRDPWATQQTPTPQRSMWRPRPPRFGPVLDWVEQRRLAPILDGSVVRMVDTPDGERRALVHRHWAGLVLRLIGAGLALIAAIVVSPALLALVVLAGVHGLLIAARRGVHRNYGIAVGGSEFVLGFLIQQGMGSGALRTFLILGALVLAVLTVMAWQVDMELVTEGGRLVRTRGLFFLKRTVAAPLTSIRIADITGPFLGLGLVTVDTTSDRDRLLHNFGLIAQPNEWAALLLREVSRKKDSH